MTRGRKPGYRKEFKDLTGQRFGSRVVRGLSHIKLSLRTWKFMCDCGQEGTAQEACLSKFVKCRKCSAGDRARLAWEAFRCRKQKT